MSTIGFEKGLQNAKNICLVQLNHTFAFGNMQKAVYIHLLVLCQAFGHNFSNCVEKP